MPTPRGDIDPNFEQQVKALQAGAALEADALQNSVQNQWMRPTRPGWNADLTAWDAFHAPFNRDVANQAVVDATSDPTNPGVDGDVVGGTTQAHQLAVLERSFRLRHTLSRIRAAAHVAGRKAGHGDDRGVLVQTSLEFLRGVYAQAKSGV